MCAKSQQKYRSKPTREELEEKYRQRAKLLKKNYFRRQIDLNKDYPFNNEIKKDIFLATSILRMQDLTDDLLALVEQRRFLASMAVLRIMFEETIAVTFTVSTLDSLGDSNPQKAQRILDKLNVGIRSGGKYLKPYHVSDLQREAEKYVQTLKPSLKGVYEESVDFLSEYVHPNGPGRFEHWQTDKDYLIFKPKAMDSEDAKMILNYGCLVLGLYQYVFSKLKKIKVKSTPPSLNNSG